MTKLDYLLGEWLFSLKPGEVSRPILTRHGWYVIKVIERKEPANRLKWAGRFHSIILAFDKDKEFDRNLQKWQDEAEIELVDAAYERVVPEWVKFRPGIRKWRTAEIPAEKEN